MRYSCKLSLLLSSIILCSVACSTSGSGGTGTLAASPTGGLGATAPSVLCPVPGELPLTENVAIWGTITETSAYTGQCGCPSNTNGASCGAGYFCAHVGGCVKLPAGATQLTASCPIQGETILPEGGCACVVPNVGRISCSVDQVCTSTGCLAPPPPPPAAVTTRRVFISSRAFLLGTAYDPYNPNSNTINSVADADSACNVLGNAVASNTHWRAWIQEANSNPALTAQNRLVPTYISGTDTRNVVLMDGKTLVSGPVSSANGVGTFSAGPHIVAINMNEKGSTTSVPASAWTGVGNQACGSWNLNSDADHGGVGSTSPSLISNWYNENAYLCSDNYHGLYCIESDK